MATRHGNFEGINELSAFLMKKVQAASPERILAAQAVAAQEMQRLMGQLPAPRRTGKMLESFVYDQDAGKRETRLGWGKFYGRLVESGHRMGGRAAKGKKNQGKRVAAKPHLKPTFENNRDRLVSLMIQELERGQ